QQNLVPGRGGVAWHGAHPRSCASANGTGADHRGTRTGRRVAIGVTMTKRRRASKRSATKPPSRKPSRLSPPSHVPTRGLYGWITHTELASSDPAATKMWCTKVLGWKFQPSFPIPGGGEYHLFAYSDKGGGGIRPNNPPEVPGSIPYVHVADTRAA